MLATNKRSNRQSIRQLAWALLLLASAFVTVSSAQEPGRRSARSLTSEDLLNRPTLYIPPPAANTSRVSTAGAVKSAASTYYRDPSGAFTLSFPTSNWRVYARAGSAGRIYNQRSFRRIEDEGFASATANVYVLQTNANLSLVDPARLSADEQRGFAATLATRFLSSNASVVTVEPIISSERAGLYIVADQTIAYRVVVRASINVFERQGRLYVIVCCASPETFDASQREFDVIANSLASSVMRS
jgi:hypothetical protein